MVREDSTIDVSSCDYIMSETGTIDVNGTTVFLDTNSPVWTIIQFDMNEPINFVTFDANFTSDQILMLLNSVLIRFPQPQQQ